MGKKYVIIKNNDGLVTKKSVSTEEYSSLFNAACILESFDYITFLGSSFEKEKEEFLSYDFSQFNVRETDMFSMMLNSLNAIATNNNLWEAYLKRTYKNDPEVFPTSSTTKKKSIFGMKDAELYDKNVEYVVAKALRNMIVHSGKPYSDIWYDDDLHRHFIVHTEILLRGDNLNNSGKKIVSDCGLDYFDVIEVIKHAFALVEDLNLFIVNFLLQKEWINFYSSRTTIRSHLGVDWQSVYIVQINPTYPPSHMMHLSTTSISKSAMNGILSIAAKSLI